VTGTGVIPGCLYLRTQTGFCRFRRTCRPDQHDAPGERRKTPLDFRAAPLYILIALNWICLAYDDVPLVAGIRYGLKPAETAIVVFAAYRPGCAGSRVACFCWLYE
jgi:hypothetical protein